MADILADGDMAAYLGFCSGWQGTTK